jgi:hypothetical protein
MIFTQGVKNIQKQYAMPLNEYIPQEKMLNNGIYICIYIYIYIYMYIYMYIYTYIHTYKVLTVAVVIMAAKQLIKIQQIPIKKP